MVDGQREPWFNRPQALQKQATPPGSAERLPMSLSLAPLHAAAASLGDLAIFRDAARYTPATNAASMNALAELTEDQECLRDAWFDFLGARVATWCSPAQLCTPEVDVESLEVHDLHALLIHPDTPREALAPVLHALRSRFERVIELQTAVV